MAPSGSGGVLSCSIWASLCLSSRLFSRRIRSMALWLAVVVSQAPGLGGTPSAGHRSTAVAKASAAASSAMSRSPKRLASDATTRAHSSRRARVIASLESPVAGFRPGGHEFERDIEVGSLDDPETGHVLLRLDEGPVGEHRLLSSA